MKKLTPSFIAVCRDESNKLLLLLLWIATQKTRTLIKRTAAGSEKGIKRRCFMYKELQKLVWPFTSCKLGEFGRDHIPAEAYCPLVVVVADVLHTLVDRAAVVADRQAEE